MNSSRIPSISAGLSNIDSNHVVKKPRLSLGNSMLHDVTNSSYSTNYAKYPARKSLGGNTTPSSQSVRLMNKYLFGDASVIEEVKKRERKILKDINHLMNAIAEVDKEIVQVKERQLPDINYQISKKTTMCNEIQKELMQLIAQLDMKENQCQLQRENGEMLLSNVQLKFSVEIQELETQLEEKLHKEKLAWEKKVLDLQNMKPSEEIAEEIKLLKESMEESKQKLKKVELDNERQCEELEKKLSFELEQFKTTKEKSLEIFTKEQQELIEQKEKLVEETLRVESETEANKNSCIEMDAKIKEVNLEVEDNEDEIKSLQKIMDEATKNLESLEKEFNLVQDAAKIEEATYNDKYEKMEQEQMKRKKLENSIDELKGNIRCFAYISQSSDSSELSLNFSDRTISTNTCIEDVTEQKIYSFSKLIPSDVLDEEELLSQEYQWYHDMCLSSKTSFNLISVATSAWNDLRTSLIKFLTTKYLPDFKITLQYVFLSEEVPSRDMLLSQSTENSGSEIKLKIEEDSLDLDSQKIELGDDFEMLRSKFAQIDDYNCSGINILKFSFDQKDVENKSQSSPTDFYFVEFYEQSSLSTLKKATSQVDFEQTPITIILKKLFSDTKSCFLFNLNTTEGSDTLLDISSKVGMIKNPKKKKSTSSSTL